MRTPIRAMRTICSITALAACVALSVGCEKQVVDRDSSWHPPAYSDYRYVSSTSDSQWRANEQKKKDDPVGDFFDGIGDFLFGEE